MNKFLERHKLIKQIQEQREYVHRFIISKGIELVIKYIATAHKENPRPDGFTGEFNRMFKEQKTIFTNSSKHGKKLIISQLTL